LGRITDIVNGLSLEEGERAPQLEELVIAICPEVDQPEHGQVVEHLREVLGRISQMIPREEFLFVCRQAAIEVRLAGNLSCDLLPNGRQGSFAWFNVNDNTTARSLIVQFIFRGAMNLHRVLDIEGTRLILNGHAHQFLAAFQPGGDFPAGNLNMGGSSRQGAIFPGWMDGGRP
jgi:hypothetical protein